MYQPLLTICLAVLAVANPIEPRRFDTQCHLRGWQKNTITVTPLSGGALSGSGFSSGFTLTADGRDKPLWSCSFGDKFKYCNPEAMDGQKIPKGDTTLTANIDWRPRNKGCWCSYMGVEYEGVPVGKVFTGVFYGEGKGRCTCSFPCIIGPM